MSQNKTTFFVPGIPAPQGSKNTFQNKKTGRINVVESSAKTLKPWRTRVQVEWKRQRAPKIGGPVQVNIIFYIQRPKSHFGTGRNAGKLKPSAPKYPAVKPDVDKLSRAVHDALTIAGAIDDDSRIVIDHNEKRYAVEQTGASIEVISLGV